MGFLDSFKANQLGTKAYRTHITALQFRQQKKYSECMKKLDEAYEMYREAYQMGYRKSKMLVSYAILSMQKGDFDQARALMLEADKDKTMTAEDRFTLRVHFSVCQWKQGHLDKAIETIRNAAKNGMNGTVYGTLGTFLVEKARETGDFTEAIEFNRQAYEYDDEDAATLDNIAQQNMYMAEIESDPEQKQHLHEEAKKYFRLAHEQKPDQVTSIYYLAKLEEQDGNREEARKLIGEALTMPITSICPVSRSEMEAYEQSLR